MTRSRIIIYIKNIVCTSISRDTFAYAIRYNILNGIRRSPDA